MPSHFQCRCGWGTYRVLELREHLAIHDIQVDRRAERKEKDDTARGSVPNPQHEMV